MSFQTPITIKKAIDNLRDKRYLLPSIQREVVWNTDRIERLFDSLMRGYCSVRTCIQLGFPISIRNEAS